MKRSSTKESVRLRRGSLRAILQRRGFSLLEVVIVVALLAITGAVVIPAVARANARSRAVQVYAELQTIALAIDRVRQATDRFPGFVSHLAEIPIDGDPTNCTGGKNTTWSGKQINKWNDDKNLFGPFHRRRLSRRASATGFVLADGWGTVNDSIGRGAATVLLIRISNVTAMDAGELDLLVDGGNGSAAGVVRWTGQADGYVSVEYEMDSPLSDC